MGGSVDRLKRERDQAAAAAWLGARLTAYAPPNSRNFVRLDKVLGGDVRRGSVTEMKTAFRAWMARDARRAG